MLLPALLALAALASPARDLPGEVMPDRDWDFEHLHLDVRIDPAAREVRGTAAHRVAPLGGVSGWVRLHGVGLQVEAVRVDGASSSWRVGDQTLEIRVPPGEGSRLVEVDYHARPQTGLHFRGPPGDGVVEVWSQGQYEDHRHWFPTWDYPNDRFTVSVDLTVPTGLVALASGEHVGTEPADDGWTRWSYSLQRPIPAYVFGVAVGDYQVFETEARVPLQQVVARGVPEAVARRTLDGAAEQLDWFEALLGTPYPYPVYRQVVVQRFLYTGMENASLTVLDERLLLHHEDARPWITELVVAHELAHQWFGNLLTCYGWRELWLNEGFATFYAGRWREHRHGPQVAALDVRQWRERALRDPAPMAARAWSKVEGREHASVYDRGAMVLHMLRVYLGDEVFDEAVRRYVARHADGAVASEDLRRVLEEVSGTHLGWLFDQWVHGSGAPEVRTSWQWREGSLTVTLGQQGGTFTAPVELEIGTGPDVLSRRVWLGPGETRLVLDLAEPPLWVAVDPRGGVLARWDHHQSPDAWLAQLEHSPHAPARLEALHRLSEATATDETLRALRREARRGHPLWRAQATTALGRLGGMADAALLDLLQADRAEVREAAARALGDRRVPAAQAPLLALTHRDPAPEVRAAALHGVAALDPERGRAEARRKLSRPDRTPGGPDHATALWVLRDLGEARDLGRALAALAPGQPRGVRHAAGEAATTILGRLDDSDRRRAQVARAVQALLADPDQRLRGLGIRLLGRSGDAQAEAWLLDYAATTTLRRHQEAARDAARSIRHQGPPAEPTPPDDLERARQRIEELEKRLERLERTR